MKLIRQISSGLFYLAPGDGLTADYHLAHRYTQEEIDRLGMVQKHATDLEVVEAAEVADRVTVGDLSSTVRGTGARKSSGKPDWSQLPLWIVPTIRDAWWKTRALSEAPQVGYEGVLDLMAQWQRGNDKALDIAAAVLLELIAAPEGRDDGRFPVRSFLSTVAVLEWASKAKYQKGNWAKGMSWSVCYTCAVSHLTKLLEGEEKDEESGLPHSAHAMCNIIFLLGYRDLFPEGDDRLPEFRPGGVKAAS